MLKESISKDGYFVVSLNGKSYLKHRLVATQWIYNDDHAIKIQFDHRNRERTENHISNLRWCTVAENNLNQSRRTYNIRYVDELPDDVIEVEHYGKHDNISDLCFHDDVFYVSDRHRYRVINKHKDHNGHDYIDVKLPN